MKLKNIAGAILALAGFAFGGSAFAAGGDIVDIRAVDSSGMRFGSRSRESGMFPDDLICSEKNPLVAGETVYFRVRMQVLNAYEVWSSGGSLTPKTWRFWDVANAKWAEDGVGPKLGLSIGNRVAWADFSPTGVEFTQFSGELKYDDDGNSTLAYRYYTDFYFSYKVQAGDVGQPIRLINKDLGIPSATEISSVPYGFLGLNVGSAAYELKNEDGTEANLCRASGLAAAWPTGPWTGTAWDGAILSYDLSQEGVFVKTVDFDKYDAAGDIWQPGKPWRRVTPGGYDKSCPAATLAVEGDVPAEDTIPLYVWSSNKDVFTIEGGSYQTINIGTTGNPNYVDVYTVQIQKGRTASDAITLRGAPGVALTATAEIFMTSTKGVVTYDAAGTPTIVAMSRPIAVTEAQPPTVKIRVNNRTDTQPKAPVVADADYTVPKADLWVIVEGETATDTVIDLRATVGGSRSVSALVAENILRLSESDYPTEQADSIAQVTVPRGQGTRQAIVHLYALGTDNDVRTDGIKFQPVIVSGDPEVTLDKSPSSNVKISRQGEEAIKFIQTNPADGSSKTLTKTDTWTINVKFADSYRNYFKPKDGAPYTYTGYTFKFMDDETGDEYVFASGVGAEAALTEGNWVRVSGKVDWPGFAIGPHPDMYFYGEAMDGSTTERIRYSINLTTSTKVVTVGLYDPTQPMTVCESDTGAVQVKLGLKSSYENGYIYLKPSTDSDKGLVASDLFDFGAAIDSEDHMQVTNPGLVRYLDGKEGVGTPVVVKAFLGRSYNNPTDKVADWTEGQLRLIVTNKAPVVKALKVANMNFKASDSGKVTATVPSGIAKTFALTSVDDVKADWDSMDIKWVIGETVIEKHGDPTNAVNTVTNTFGANLAGKTVEVEVYVKDKDMATYPDLPNFSCLMPIGPKPGVRIETEGTVSDTFMETATDGSQLIHLTLSEPATEEMAVKFTVGNPSSGDGYILFQTTEGVVEAGEAKDEYVVKFPATVTTRTLRVVKVGGMDGTGTTEDGIVLNAVVTNETANADGIPWKDYFSAADPLPVYVMNAAPQFKHPSELECATTNESASINTPYSIKIQAADVPADVTNRWTYAGQEVQGIRFEVSVDNVPLTNGFLTVSNVVSAIQATDQVMVNVEFDSVGVHTVEVVFEDKDGAGLDDPRQIVFNVKSSKVLKLFPVGPGPANSTLGSAYAGYPGIGAGRVFAGLASQGPQKVENFIHTYSFLNTQKDVDAWAFGYLADGKADDGNLVPGPDRGIDATGNWNKTLTIDDYYNYTEDHKYGKSGYDSFMYGWIGGAASDEGEVEAKLFPYLQKTGYKSIALPDGNSNSGSSSSKDEVKTYPLQKWEAVFSREFLKSDNCGDINADGIPDCILFGYGLGIVDVVTKEITGDGGDKADASKYNGDLNPNPRGYEGESTEGDFLPVEPVAMYDGLIPGLISSWDEPFTAILEIRGVSSERNAVSPLNDALATEFPDGVPNRLAQPEFESDVCFLDPDTNPTSTLSRVEFMAWRDYAAAHGIADPDDPASWRKDGRLVWSPERPTDPTLVDTDGDGFPDGYEYYYWYRAHVGYMDGNVHRYLTGRAYDPRNPGEGTFISAADIEIAMDPIVASGNLEQDTDNDGLPDILEMLIGTNPFDFDTDGDGLPDGFEIMLGGTDPLLAETTKGVSDAMRNFDGDAMAFTTPFLETKYVKPVPLVTDMLYTFALVDADGDTDGVQWYVGKTAPKLEDLQPLETCVTGTSFTVGGKTYVTRETVPVVDGRLAADLDKAATWEVLTRASLTNSIPSLTNLVWIVDETNDVGEVIASLTNVTDFVALMPTRFAAGTEVAGVKTATYATLKFADDVTGVNAAWVYGRSVTAITTGDSLANLGGFGMLAIGRYQDAPKGVRIAALPAEDENVAYLHHFVYQEFGFDPRTAWNANTPLAPRWGKTVGTGESTETVANNTSGNYGYAGVSTRTREYTLYDEFLVMSFFLNNGKLTMADVTATQAFPWEKIWAKFTTNGQGPNEPNWEEDNDHYKGRTAETNSGTNGADTDMDGVPDGWELYVMAGPKVFDKKAKEFKYNLVAPYNDGFFSAFGPFVGDAAKASTTDNTAAGANETAAGDGDGLTELQEYAGTDSCAYYCEPWGGNAAAFSATIVRPEEHAKWLNKFFPTDPWNKDTDGDGLTDNEFASQGDFKCARFMYGTPVDDGKRCCIPGAGLNPCTVDTDRDGLPDGWEAQYAGQTVYAGDDKQVMKGKNGEEGTVLQGLCDGMDGTVFDAYNSPRINNGGEDYKVIMDGVDQVVDRDYDRDGLENWQEYLTGAMRCWRYDDPITVWDYVPDAAFFNPLTGEFDLAAAMRHTGIKNPNEFWYRLLFDTTSKWYNPHFVTASTPSSQYFSRVTNGWDQVFAEAGTYYMFFNRRNGDDLNVTWGKDYYNVKMAPRKYIGTSPIAADTDQDGMDDGYELFHGMNPILGAAAVLKNSNGPCDIVYDAWYVKGVGSPVNALENPWIENIPGNGKYDFIAHPWLNGLVDADPDGDDIRNQDEAIMPLVAPHSVWLHTDPTPLWMTDSSYGDSIVSRFFRLPSARGMVPVPDSIVFNGEEYSLVDCDGYMVLPLIGPVIQPFLPDYWSVTGEGAANWAYSFEENEGFDTDHDSGSDFEEKQGKFRSATDPQDADSPRRRQAMYFPGEKAALQSMPFVKEAYPRAAMGYPDDMSFLQYTVECWVRPEAADPTKVYTVLERTSYTDPSHVADERYVRRNFAIQIKNGKWCTAFDTNGTLDDSLVEVIGRTDAKVGEWTHVAATYDANRLTLYVNGGEDGYVLSSLKPEYGSSAVVTYPAGSGSVNTNDLVVDDDLEALKGTAHAYWFDGEYTQHAFLIGASFAEAADGNHLDVTKGQGWRRYKEFFKGYVDEVRVWDGARSSGDIAADMKKRYTREDALANRDEFYDQWMNEKRRYNKDGNGKDMDVIPELRFHWAFDSIPGAENAAAVAQAPHGFLEGTKPVYSRPDGYRIPWWSGVVGAYGSVYEGERNWVPWIPNTVTHLPRLDMTTLDSAYWSENYAGDEKGTYKFARTAEPVSKWTQYVRNGTDRPLEFRTTGRRFWLTKNAPSNTMSMVSAKRLSSQFEFTGRHLNQTGDDLLPLGGAFAKYVDVMWDEQGASSVWEQTGVDADGDGLPDWWQEYAEQNYREGVPEGTDITWNTEIWYGVGDTKIRMKAGDAYRRDLAKGVYVDAKGEVHPTTDERLAGIYKTIYEQVADEDRNGIPDWWADFYGIRGESGLADHDNDGLPNYAEYLLSEVFSFKTFFDPTKADSVRPGVPDYFFKVGELYAGEIFTDHDLVDDAWEDLYPASYASRLAWDAFADADDDGWSNRSECRSHYWGAGFFPDIIDTFIGGNKDNQLRCFPQPAIRLKVSYTGHHDPKWSRLIVRAWRTGEYNYAATFVVGSMLNAEKSKEQVLGIYSGRPIMRGFLQPGLLDPSSVKFQKTKVNSEYTYHWHCTECTPPDHVGSYEEYKDDVTRHGDAETDPNHLGVSNVKPSLTWDTFVAAYGGSDGQHGVFYFQDGDSGEGGTEEVGTINYRTGEYSLNLDLLKEKYGCDFDGMAFMASYTYSLGEYWPQTVYLSYPEDRYVREGKNNLEAFFDLNGDGAWQLGEPYGVVRDVDVSWEGATAEIELTDLSPVTPRIVLAGSEEGGKETETKKDEGEGTEGDPDEFDTASDRGRTLSSVIAKLRQNLEYEYSGRTTTVAYSNALARLAWIDNNRIETTSFAAGEFREQRLRVIRWLINGVPAYRAGSNMRTVLDKKIWTDVRSVLTEADFLVGNGDVFDLDWKDLSTEVINNDNVRSACGNVTEVSYLVVVGDGPADWYLQSTNNYAVKALNTVIVRKFGKTPVTPVAVAPGAEAEEIVYSANPTFKWTMNCPEEEGFTAFNVQVLDGSKVVYDSGKQLAPPRNIDGQYVWEAPLYVGDKTLKGEVFENKKAYTWQVAMYNAKFSNAANYSKTGKFRMQVQTNGYEYGSANVAVRYFGPKSSYQKKNPVIRVRAYTSPDFTGIPVAAGYVANPDDPENGLTAGTNAAPNCTVIGIPSGTYYLQAFIDSNANGVCDPWETQGYLCTRNGSTAEYLDPTAITFGPEVGKGDLAVIYLEDADKDGDGLPDAWEYAEFGSLEAKGVEKLTETKAGEFVVNEELSGKLALYENAHVPTAGLAGEVRNMLMKLSSPAGVSAVTGIDPADIEVTDGGLEVKSEVDPETLTITGFAVDAAQNRVLLKVGAETTANVDAAVANFLNIRVRKGAEVTVKVERAASPAGPWTVLDGVGGTVTVDRAGTEIEVNLTGELPAQGYFRARIDE